MKPKKIFMMMCLVLFSISGYAQVAISDGGTPDPDPASVLDLQSTSKGFLIPRMTQAQKAAIANPPTGLMIFQTDGTPGFYYNSGTPDTPDWNMITDEDTGGSGGGYWSQKESNIYYNSGYVGIGTDIPGAALDVQGAGWLVDSIAIGGDAGSIYLNSAAGNEPFIRFAQMGNTALKLRYSPAGNSFGDDYLLLDSDISDNVWGVTNYGRVRQDYQGSYQAHLIYSGAPRSALSIDNSNNAAGARGLNATISNSNSDESSVAVLGFNNGEGSAVYGANTDYSNFAYLGTNQYGVYGENGNGNWGAIGTESSALYGVLGDNTGAQVLDPGDFAVKGRGVIDATQEGTGYAYNATLGGMLGYNTFGPEYTFGIAGYTATLNEKRSGAVLGSLNDGSVWGCLAYRTSGGGNRYGGYFTSYADGSGKSSTGVITNVGVGAWGNLMGASIFGQVYGLYASGSDYSIYARGDVYRTGADVHLQENSDGNNTVMYTLVTTDMVVQTYGVGQLEKGKAGIVFDAAFAEVVDAAQPIVVTITPIGKSNGVYLDEVGATGFSVSENDRGRSDVQFSWIAIGKRKGFENKALPEDVVASDYGEKIMKGIGNDNDPNARSEGLYYRDGRLYNGEIQQAKAASPQSVTENIKREYRQKQEAVEENDLANDQN